VRSSLVVAERDGPDGGTTRYRLLHPLRSFALERLAERGDLASTWARFADLTLVRAVEVNQHTAWQPDALADLVTLAEDMLACLRWSVAEDDEPERAVSLLALLWGVIHDSHLEDAEIVGELVRARWPEPTGGMWSQAMATLATANDLLGAPEKAIALADRAREAADTALARCMTSRVIGRSNACLGALDAAAEGFRAAIDAAEEGDFPALARESTTFLAVVQARQGDVDGALGALAANEAAAVAEDDRMNELWARIAQAFVRLGGDPAASRSTFGSLVELCRQERYTGGLVASLQGLTTASIAVDDDEAAAAALAELLDAFVYGELVGELRSALLAAAVLMHRRGDQAWSGVAAAAAALPVVSTFSPLAAPLLALPEPGRSAPSTTEAVATARRFLAGTAAGPDAAAAAHVSSEEAEWAGRFQRQGDAWAVEWAGRALLVRTSKGMSDLARLLAEQGRDVHCLELAGATTDQNSTGEIIDDTARRQYEQRIRDLQADIDHAEADNDHARADAAQAEFDAIVEHLANALGLGGRARRGASTAERARSAVTHRIRSTIRRLGDEHPELGRHLAASITTGIYCTYRPEHEVTWTL
jgi:hypothetical protein